MTTTIDRPPERSTAQRFEALRVANEIRTARARVKHDLKARRVDVRALLADPPDYLARMKVHDLLVAVPRCGEWSVVRLLRACDIAPSRTVGGLTGRQRRALVEAVGEAGTKGRRWAVGSNVTIAVRMGMGLAEAEALSEVLLRVPADVRERLHDQLWLKAVLTEQRTRTRVAERAQFDRRADKLLELLDPPEEPSIYGWIERERCS